MTVARPITVLFGTRPEAIKLAPIISELRSSGHPIRIISTGQHAELLESVQGLADLTPDVALGLMRDGQSPADFVSRAVAAVNETISRHEHSCLVVQGDTATALAGALASCFADIPVVHVEAGLRTGNARDPFPEEMHRRLIGDLATLHLAPTEGNRRNLLAEAVRPERIVVTGNSVVDAATGVVPIVPRSLTTEDGRGKVLLVTTHRRENIGVRQREIFSAINQILEMIDELSVVLPVHPNPEVRAGIERELQQHDRLHLVDPLPYPQFISLLRESWAVLTDSGGVQEEAPIFGVPTLVARETTERPEAIEAGSAVLTGTRRDAIVREISNLWNNERAYEKMAVPRYPFGQPGSSRRIAEEILRFAVGPGHPDSG